MNIYNEPDTQKQTVAPFFFSYKKAHISTYIQLLRQ